MNHGSVHRSVLRTAAILLFVVLTFGCASRPDSSALNLRNGLPIVQGLTNAHATQIAIVAPESMKLRFSYGPARAPSHPPESPMKIIAATAHTSAGSKTRVHHVQIDGLLNGVAYRLEIHDQDGQRVDAREFQTLDTSSRPARIAVASCLYDAFLVDSRVMWKSLLDAKPDLILLIGDNVYAEISNGRFKSPLDESALWIRYVETFQALDFYKTKRLTPTLVTWDDHDYGMKDGDITNPHKLEAGKVLKAFFPQAPAKAFPEFSAGPGVSSLFDAFGYRFLLLDDRSFRSPEENGTTGRYPQSHFGQEQENWIFRNTKESPRPVWLISGDQWFGGYHRFESYEGSHPESFKKFIQTLARAPRPVMFMSGDRHLSEVSRIEKSLLGYETFEFTSSSLHSKPHPSNWETIPNKRQIRGIDMVHSFTMFDLTPPDARGKVDLKGAAVGPESKVLYSFDLVVRKNR